MSAIEDVSYRDNLENLSFVSISRRPRDLVTKVLSCLKNNNESSYLLNRSLVLCFEASSGIRVSFISEEPGTPLIIYGTSGFPSTKWLASGNGNLRKGGTPLIPTLLNTDFWRCAVGLIIGRMLSTKLLLILLNITPHLLSMADVDTVSSLTLFEGSVFNENCGLDVRDVSVLPSGESFLFRMITPGSQVESQTGWSEFMSCLFSNSQDGLLSTNVVTLGESVNTETKR